MSRQFTVALSLALALVVGRPLGGLGVLVVPGLGFMPGVLFVEVRPAVQLGRPPVCLQSPGAAWGQWAGHRRPLYR